MVFNADISQLNRPKALNSFGGTLMIDLIGALRELDEHPTTVFTVLTGEGRFFSSGADVKGKYTLQVSQRWLTSLVQPKRVVT